MLPSQGMQGGLPTAGGLKPLGSTQSSMPLTPQKKEIAPPKCFGTDYFGKWNTTGMTFDSMKVDRPDYQSKCCNCPVFERCYQINHIRIMRIKR